MKIEKYIDYILEKTKEVLSIDSPTGYTKDAAEYVFNEYKKLGYKAKMTVKGGVLVDLGGKDDNDAIVLAAHVDTLGAIVKEIKSNGYLKLSLNLMVNMKEHFSLLMRQFMLTKIIMI